jgi:hypothetical protein
VKKLFRSWLLRAVWTSLFLISPAAWAQRPTAPQILPPYTLGLVRIPDAPLLAQKFQETSLGRVVQDKRMQPLVGQLYRSAQDAFKQVEQVIGVPLDQLLKIPQGEVCVAFVAPEDREQEQGFVLIIDTKDEVAQARKLIASAEAIAARNGGNRLTEKFGNEEINIFTGLGPRIFEVEREGTFIFATSRPIMENVVANLNGAGVERTLAETEKFATVMSRCAGDDQPHFVWYVDPIALVRRLASGSLAATGLALFPALGLDGLQAAGGTMSFSSGEFDQVQHLHILLDNPRIGVIDAIGLASGDMTPETWVPADCISYSTIHWDLRHTVNVASRLYNGLMGDGQLEQQIQTRFSGPVGADVLTEIVPQLSGRATHVQWVERPVRINSPCTIVGLQLKDPKTAKPVFDKIVQKHSSSLEKQRYGQFEYWASKIPDSRMQKAAKAGMDVRQPMPCLGIINDYFIFTDSMKAFQELVTSAANPDRSLTTSLDFKLIASKVRRQPGGDAPGAVVFSRPEEGMRFWYDMANAENTRKRLADQAGRNRVFGALDQALRDNPLPPFEVIAEYMAPAGGMLVSDPTGIHYMTFGLKRQ